MNTETIARLFSQYTGSENQFIFDTSKEKALAHLEGIRKRIEQMPDFAEFPEGRTGVLIFTMLALDAETCPDVGDFNHIVQGYQKILDAAASVIIAETNCFGLGRRDQC